MYELQRDITLSLLGRVHAKCLERKYLEIVKSKLHDCQKGFRSGRSTTDHIFTLKQIFEISWEYGKDLFACLVDLAKAYYQVPPDLGINFGKFLQEYGIDGRSCDAPLGHSTADKRFVFG